MEMLTLIPQAFAKNMIIKDMRMETASMFTVAPPRLPLLLLFFATPLSSSLHSLLLRLLPALPPLPPAFTAAVRRT